VVGCFLGEIRKTPQHLLSVTATPNDPVDSINTG
jgi:hypothetical protein